jgi:hypothetical protein
MTRQEQIVERLIGEGLDEATAMIVAGALDRTTTLADIVDAWVTDGRFGPRPRVHGYSPQELAEELGTRREVFATLFLLHGDAESAMTVLGYPNHEPLAAERKLLISAFGERDPYLLPEEAKRLVERLGEGDPDIWRAAVLWASEGEMPDFPEVFSYTPKKLDRFLGRPSLVFGALKGLRSRIGNTDAQMAIHELIALDTLIQPNRAVLQEEGGNAKRW